jgi:hypothetical protein
VAAVAIALGGVPLAGCGGKSGKDSSGEGAGGEEADQRQAEALAKVPQSDQTAFIQLATVIGALRARAAPVAVGTSRQLGSAAPLRKGRSQVIALRPSDPTLVKARKELLPALTRFSRAPSTGAASRRAARAAIADADRIEAGLRSYAQTRPAIGGLIPD